MIMKKNFEVRPITNGVINLTNMMSVYISYQVIQFTFMEQKFIRERFLM